MSSISNEPAADNRIPFGRCGEAAVASHLGRLGWSILDRNWRCPAGELDIIALEPIGATGRAQLVIIEVKSRWMSPDAERHLFDTVTVAKQRRLCRLADLYLLAHPRFRPSQRAEAPIIGIRIDVAGVLMDPELPDEPRIIHLRAAVGRL